MEISSSALKPSEKTIDMSRPSNDIDFKDLITKYKREHFKTVPMIDHDFLYSCLHPQSEEFVLCLERNIFPSELKICDLQQIRYDADGTRKVAERRTNAVLENDDIIEEEEKDETAVVSSQQPRAGGTRKGRRQTQSFGELFQTSDIQKSLGLSIDKKLQESENNNQAVGLRQEEDLQIKFYDTQVDAENEVQKEPSSGASQITEPAPNNGGEDNKESVFEFNDSKRPKGMRVEDIIIDADEESYKYAISKWKINKNRNALQVTEIGFNEYPANNQFYVSQDGSYIYYFQGQSDESNSIRLKKVVVIDAHTLQKKSECSIPKFSNSIVTDKNYYDSALWNDGKYLMLQFRDRDNILCYIFLSISRKKKVMGFQERYLDINVDYSRIQPVKSSKAPSIDQDNKFMDDDDDDDLEERDNLSESETKQKRYYLYIQKVCFKENDHEYIYVITYRKCYSHYYIYKIKFEDIIDKYSFNEINLFEKIEMEGLQEVTDFQVNRDLTQYFLIGNKTIFIANLGQNHVGRRYVKQDSQDIIDEQENPFLNEELMYCLQDEQNNIYAYFAKDNKQYPLKGLSSSTCFISDIRRTKDNAIVFLSKMTKSSNITVNYIEHIWNYTVNDVCLTYIQELSEIQCLYPYVFYCKGNKEIYIQSMNNSKSLLKLELDDMFICFVETSPLFEIQGNFFNQNQSICFLTQKKDAIYLNILEYNQFRQPIVYKLYRQKQSFKRLDSMFVFPQLIFDIDQLGYIIKAIIMKAERKLNEEDFIIVMQYRNAIIIKSLYSNYPQQQIEKSIVPLIYCPIKNEDQNFDKDSIFFLQKEGLSCKIQRLQYSEDDEQYLNTYYEVKSATINMFTKHGDHFYFMDESMQVKVLRVDSFLKKVKLDLTLDLANTTKNTWDPHYSSNSIITDNTIYQRNKVAFTYNSQEISKDYEFFSSWQTLFNCDEVIMGPIKLEQANCIVYVVKKLNNDYQEIQNFRDTPQTRKVTTGTTPKGIANGPFGQGLGHTRRETKQLLFNDNSEGDEEEIESQQSANVSSGYSARRSQGHEIERNLTLYQKKKQRFMTQLDESMDVIDQINADEGHSKNTIVFIPLVDKNEIPLIYHNKDNIPATFENHYPQIQRSTYVDQQENILVIIQNQYLLYSRGGVFRCFIRFTRLGEKPQQFDSTQMKLLQMSNMSTNPLNVKPFFLFINFETNKLMVYTFENEDNDYFFLFVKEFQSFKTKSYYKEDSYFNQEIINDEGEVLQVKTHKEDSGDIRIIFEVYCDGRILYSRLASTFKLLAERTYVGYQLEHDKPQEFRYAIMNDYLFILKNKRVEYTRIFPFHAEFSQGSSKATMMNFSIDEKSKIKRIISVEGRDTIEQGKLVKIPSVVQFVFDYASEENQQELMYVLTWNLEKNIEYSMMQLKDIDLKQSQHLVCKGYSENLNYIVIDQGFYDLQYQVPFTFIKHEKSKFNYQIPKFINERKLSKNESNFLGLGDMSHIYSSYSLYNLIYWNEFQQHTKMHKKIDPSIIHLQHFSPLYNGNTIFHLYASNRKLIKIVYDEVKKFEGEHHENPFLFLFFQLIYPNAQMQSPFDLVFDKMDQNSIQTLEIIMKMFIELKEYKISQFIKKRISKLLTLGLPSFEKYLEHCAFQNLSMQDQRSLRLKFGREEIYFDYHSSFIGKDFSDYVLKGYQKKKNKSIKSKEEKDKEIKEDEQIKNVEISALEFDWIFYGDDSNSFIKTLADTKNDNLFAISTVRTVVLFLWKQYYKRIFYLQLIPFVIYLLFFCVYVTFIYDKVQQEEELGIDVSKWHSLHNFFVVINVLLTAYFIIFEILQFGQRKANYFKKVWNWIDMITYLLNIIFILTDLAGADPLKVRPLGSIAVFLMWFKLLYFLRLFIPTLYMIKMIIEVFYDMYTFIIVLALAMLAFGNAFYILAVNALDAQSVGLDPTDISNLVEFTGENSFLMALIYTYNLGLGNFPSSYEGLQDEALIWCLFVFEAMLIQVILLNLLIAILSDTFTRVQSKKDVFTLKEICNMIYENQFILDRSKEYKYSKYIIIVKQEQIKANSSGSGEGQFARLKNEIEEMVIENKDETKRMIDVLRKENLSNYNKLDMKFTQSIDSLSFIEQSVREMKKIQEKAAIQQNIDQKQSSPVKEDPNKMNGLNRFQLQDISNFLQSNLSHLTQELKDIKESLKEKEEVKQDDI